MPSSHAPTPRPHPKPPPHAPTPGLHVGVRPPSLRQCIGLNKKMRAALTEWQDAYVTAQ